MRCGLAINKELVEKARASLARYEASLPARFQNGSIFYRPLAAVRVSFDQGGHWKLAALCDECIAGIEPPTRLKREGVTGARTCDWCGARAEDYMQGEI